MTADPRDRLVREALDGIHEALGSGWAYSSYGDDAEVRVGMEPALLRVLRWSMGSGMDVKLIEVRDEGTFVPVLAVRLRPRSEQERWLLARAGYGRSPDEQGRYVVLVRIVGGTTSASYDPHSWGGGARTMPVAHQHLIDHWGEYDSGDVLDVEHVLGITAEPKRSERETTGY